MAGVPLGVGYSVGLQHRRRRGMCSFLDELPLAQLAASRVIPWCILHITPYRFCGYRMCVGLNLGAAGYKLVDEGPAWSWVVLGLMKLDAVHAHGPNCAHGPK